MARKGWDALSDNYRKRIENAGLTRADYEADRPIKKARGHSKTPERPKGYDPQKFPQYEQERQRLTRDLVAKKQAVWGQSPKWNPRKAAENINKYAPPLRLIRQALAMDAQEMLDAIRENPKAFAWLGYH